MTLSIPIPVVPIKLTIGKEKKEDTPVAAPVVTPVAPVQSSSGLDGRDIAIVCVTTIAMIAIIAILIMAMRHH